MNITIINRLWEVDAELIVPLIQTTKEAMATDLFAGGLCCSDPSGAVTVLVEPPREDGRTTLLIQTVRWSSRELSPGLNSLVQLMSLLVERYNGLSITDVE